MLNGVMLLWFLLLALSLLFVIYDSVTNTPVSWVQKLAWILVIFYTGVIGLFFYLLACRNPGPGLHSQFTSAHWKQALNSEMHCLAGDASGIVLAAIVVPYFHLSNGIDLILEYLTAFIVGLLIFQALMMKSMYQNNYLLAVQKTLFAETVSMNMVMLGMIPVMVILMHLTEYSHNPLHPLFWFIMGMATIAGGICAYPINSWLVRNKLKHGCMTLIEEPDAMDHAHHDIQEPMQAAHNQHMQHEHSAAHKMGGLAPAKAGGIVIGTFMLLFLITGLTSLLAPISFSL